MPTTVVLETFQTYHAIFRSVNPSPKQTRAAKHWRSTRHEARSKRAIHTAPVAPFLSEPAHKHTGASNLAKELVLEVRDLANLSRDSVPDFQPCGQGSY
jgi:plasmid stability protein